MSNAMRYALMVLACLLAAPAHAATENRGKRIVVTVGAEHGYWLREHLGTLPDVQLPDTAALLDQAQRVATEGTEAVDAE